jgi:PadR family transcriptional regulator PadR
LYLLLFEYDISYFCYLALQVSDILNYYLILQVRCSGGDDLLSIHSQLLKGILEGCILFLISQEEIYGYQIHLKLGEYGFTFVSEGSIYPILLRLQKEKFIQGEMKPSPSGPMRKYYHITPEGRIRLNTFLKEWNCMRDAVDSLISGRMKK